MIMMGNGDQRFSLKRTHKTVIKNIVLHSVYVKYVLYIHVDMGSLSLAIIILTTNVLWDYDYDEPTRVDYE